MLQVGNTDFQGTNVRGLCAILKTFQGPLAVIEKEACLKKAWSIKLSHWDASKVNMISSKGVVPKGVIANLIFFLEEESRSLLRRNVSLKLPSSNLLLLNERPPSQSSSAISDVTSRTRFQASSGNSGSEDWPGYEAAWWGCQMLGYPAKNLNAAPGYTESTVE